MSRYERQRHRNRFTPAKAIYCFICLILSVGLLVSSATGRGEPDKGEQSKPVDYAIMDRFDTKVNNSLSDAMGDLLSIEKVYWLSDDELIAPEPNQNCYGETEDAASLGWLLEDAQKLLDGQETLFTTQTVPMKGTKVCYYLDETIMVITWKEVRDDAVYTISEVKIADPSQFRRFLADGVYSSGRQYIPSEMAKSVNAVVAANGDFYAFRNMGIIVYDSQLMRMEGREMDTCFIDKNGDLQFAYTREMTDKAETEKFVQDNGVRFSLAFGPVLVDNGEICKPKTHYPVGEGNVRYARAALCQMDSLHYLLVAASSQPPYGNGNTLEVFAKNLQSLGVDKAYNLDGGQSATIVMNDKLANYVWERKVSDIIYFATAIPDGK